MTGVGKETSRPLWWKDAKGFSLPEVVSAFAISMILTGMFAFFVSNVAKSSLWMETMNDVVKTANLATLRVGKLLQVSGGGPLRPWDAVWVENNCTARDGLPDCQQSDRITIAKLDRDSSGSVYPSCTMTSTGYNSASGEVSVVATPTCCLNAGYVNQSVALVDEGKVRYRYVNSVDLGTCTLDTSDHIQAQGLTNAGPTDSFADGTVSRVEVSTYYLDVAQSQLMAYTSNNNDAALDPSEIRQLERDIFDFQVSLAYDVEPRDGYFWNTQSELDEWLYNSSTDVWGADGLTNAKPSDLRMIYVGLTAGSPDNRSNATSSHAGIFDGPARSIPGWTLFNVTRKVSLRNNLVFY